VALRVEHFTAPPATGPVTHVVIRNLGGQAYEGDLRLELPDGWRWSPETCPVALEPGATKRVPFTVEKAVNVRENAYPVKATASGAGTEVVREQRVVCASAPYFKPEIDGSLEEWDDSLPVRLATGGKETVVRTYWNRRAFCLSVEVEEDGFTVPKDGPRDAIQFALAVRDAKTGSAPSDLAGRCEFLVSGGGSRRTAAKCFALMKPGMPLSVAGQSRPLAGLELPEAQAAVRRKKGVTYYECAVPFSAMPDLTPREGREIRFSLLVHDPDGTGLRDWGEAAGLWPSQRNRLAWCSWEGVEWGAEAPFDGKIEWGLCSSIH